MSGGNFMTSKKGKTILGYAYAWGAAVVILGALFKIMHWKGASEMLIIGMGT
jgi:gliding motility-associated protein GldL